MQLEDIMARTRLPDLESARGGRIRHVGAVFQGAIFKKGAGKHADLLNFYHFCFREVPSTLSP